jgi:ABC-type transport system involved in cytochrome c biogenesis permease subunit
VILALHLVALLGYLGAWGVLWRAFRSSRGSLETPGWRIAVAAVLVHAAGLVAFVARFGTLPLVGMGPASSTLALAIAVLGLGAAVRAERRPAMLFVLPIVLALLGLAAIVGLRPVHLDSAFRGPWFVFHVSVVFVGCAGLVLSSAAGAMYVLQFRALKRKSFGSVFRFFPSLDVLEKLNRLGLFVGFPGLTLGLLAGWSWTLTYGRGLALRDPQVLFGVVTWLAYLAAIVARLSPRWRGERAASISAGAFVVSALVFVVLRVLIVGPESVFL